MKLAPVLLNRSSGMGHMERAHSALNAAYNALSVDQRPATLPADIGLAQRYVREAHAEVAGHDGLTDAGAAARALLPRLEHALYLLDVLGVSRDPRHVAPLLDELGSAMDHVEEVLAGAGWD